MKRVHIDIDDVNNIVPNQISPEMYDLLYANFFGGFNRQGFVNRNYGADEVSRLNRIKASTTQALQNQICPRK